MTEREFFYLTVDGFEGAASAGSFELTVTLRTCGNGVLEVHAGEQCDDGNDSSDDGCGETCQLEIQGFPTDCSEIHHVSPLSPSGDYDIYPEGNEASKVRVHCDMEVDGGGWTRIFIAEADDYASTALGYTVDSLALREASDAVLIGFADDWTTRARFPMPEPWVAQAPMSYKTSAEFEFVDIPVWLDGAEAPQYQTLRYGWDGFEPDCGNSWNDAYGSRGRICVAGTLAPFWAGFAVEGGDYCNASWDDWDTTPCGDERRFAIQVRRSICGNGTVEVGESCDPAAQDPESGFICTDDCLLYELAASPDCLAIKDAIPEAQSGLYTIDVDGEGGAAPIEVWCEMTLQGGGWTRIFLADSDDLNDTQTLYTVEDAALRAGEQRAMMG